MPFFTDQMAMLTNELQIATRERAAFVGHVQDLTHKHLAEAQTFLHGLAEEHEARAAGLRESLATNRHEQSAALHALRQRNREELRGMREGLQALLARTRQERQDNLARKRNEFHAAQQELARDLRQAAQVWRQLEQTRATAPQGGRPRGN